LTILYPERFAQAKPAGFDGIFDWDFLKPAFIGTKIEPMDIDGVVERRGKVLLFETKAQGKDIPMGQRITLERLILIGRGDIHLMILYGKTEKDISAVEEWYFSGGKVVKNPIIKCDATYILRCVKFWFDYANGVK